MKSGTPPRIKSSAVSGLPFARSIFEEITLTAVRFFQYGQGDHRLATVPFLYIESPG
jgi:hypothetical protein